jgi:general secretion pathway protein D
MRHGQENATRPKPLIRGPTYIACHWKIRGFTLVRMLYSRERHNWSEHAAGGCIERSCATGQRLGMCHNFYGVKDTNEGSMDRGTLLIMRAYRLAVGAIPLVLLFACCLVLSSTPARAQSASTWAKRGAAAELHDDFDGAYEDYRQAHLKKPKDMRIQADYDRLRFQAAVAHVDRGRVLKQSGDMQGALAEFTRALQIDAGNQAAQQEINLLQAASAAAPNAALEEQMAGQNEVLSNINAVAGPVQLQQISHDPITYHAVEDAKVIYQAIGKSAGLNVLFDPDFQSKRIPVDLTSVSPLDALRIVGTLANAFYKPVTPNTIFVAQNNRTKHTDLDELAIQTFYLTNAIAPNDANEVVTTLRNLLDPSIKVYPVLSQNAIVMRATPDELLLAQKLLNDLDRTRSEVVVDVAVLEVNRDKMRNLGITLPQSITLTPQASPTTTTSTSTSTTTTTPSNFTLNTLAHMNATNFAVTITGGTLTALLNDSDTHVLQNPRIRATDGQRATLKIGSKIPIATGSYNAGVSTGTASIGVQTQFQYLDIGVNIDMTPTVHYDREITLKLQVEVLSQTSTVTISGVTQPVIGQRSVNQVIQLREGEPAVLAGIITKMDNLAVSGTPGLGELPFIKYFFSTQSKEVQMDEIVFLLIPHIVRESLITKLNTRAIDTGTLQDISVRQDANADDRSAIEQRVNPARPATPPAPSAANVASSVVGQMGQQVQRPQPPPPGVAQAQPPTPAQVPATTATQPQAQAPAGPPVNLTVVPANSNQTVGSTFQVAVMLTGGSDIYSVPLQLQFNPAVLQLVNVDAGDLLSRDGQAVALSHRDDGSGMVTISTSRPPGVTGVNGAGSVCTLTFKAVAAGDSNLALVKVGARNSAQASLPAVGSQAVVHVK